MHKIRFFIKISLLVLIVLQGTASGISAEQLNSVKDCLEDSSKCSEEQLNEQTEDEDAVKGETDQEMASVGLSFWDFLKMIFATIFVIGLLYIVLRFINKRNRTFSRTRFVENLGGTALGTNRSVQIVKVGKSVMILGVGDDIQLLKEISDEEEAKQIIEDFNQQMDQLIQPSDIVTKLIERTKQQVKQKDQGTSAFANILKAQLDDISKGRKKILKEMETKEGPEKR